MFKFKMLLATLGALNLAAFAHGDNLWSCAEALTRPPRTQVSTAEATAVIYFRNLARDQWKFYEESVNATTNFLPPDNVTVGTSKSLVVDYRTSPTNIGLYMLSTAVAQKMGLISLDEALSRLRQTVISIQKLPKFTTTVHDQSGRGHSVEHLYNWYSINGTPAEIGNKFISTVDNGNLAAFLIATITAVGDSDPTLVYDLQKIVETMRFDVLYDAKNNALYHGAQVKDGKLYFTPGHYDMVISEARSAYAVAILLGQIPTSAWTNLKSKIGTEIANLDSNPELKLQSYTGTMFEYYTPRLYMRHQGTPLDEADRQAVALQMKDVVGGIWGKSEANSNTSRGYAAWGVRGLSQSREFIATGDQVIAPYASQLAVGLAPMAVAKNLRAMDDLGLRERYGQFESVTIKGGGLNLHYQVSPQFYAHHVGMGFVSLANYLHENFVQDWFEQSSYNNHGVVAKLLRTPVAQYRQPSTLKNFTRAPVTNAYAYEPQVTYNPDELVGNGEFVTFAPGLGGSTWLGKTYAFSHNEVFFVRDNKSQKLIPLKLDTPDTIRTVGGARYFDYHISQPGGGSLDITVEVSASSVSKTKVSKISIHNRTSKVVDLQVTGYVDWIMDDVNRYLDHTVYRNLYTLTQLSANGRIITARRRTMQGPEQERQPFGFFAISDDTKGNVDWADGSRTHILGRLGSLTAPRAVVEGKSAGEFGPTLDPAAALAKTLVIDPGKSSEVSFVLGYSDNAAQIPQLVASASLKTSMTAHGIPTLPPDRTHDRMRDLFQRTQSDLRINSQPKPISSAPTRPETIGHWEQGGRKFIIDDPFAPKKPWSMVVSNGKYGFVATQSGWAYSFGANSQQMRVTPYAPDITTESPLRGLLVKDKNSGETWSITPNPAPSPNGKYEVEVSPGYIKYKFRRNDGLAMSMTMFVARKTPMEFWQIEVNNDSAKDVDLELSSFLKWAIGANYPRTASQTVVTYDSNRRAIFAHSSDAAVPQSVGFHGLVGNIGQVTNNNLYATANDPFSGLTTSVQVGVGQSRQLSFVVGLAENGQAANHYLELYESFAKVALEGQSAISEIATVLDGLQVRTPDESLNTMLNTWLPYQSYYAHYLARSGFYQSGGAYGFRDQLQTIMNMIGGGQCHFRTVARNHIVESTRHQFEKGDVQHWWHPHNNLGQRSTISDNLLWLPLAISQYLEVTGDMSILKEVTPFSVASRELNPGELDFVEAMGFSDKKVTVYDHAKRAIALVLSERMGVHGLPLIGKGDWNDALDRVGHLGKGESVWLGFFLYDVLIKFAEVAKSQGDVGTQFNYREAAAKLKQNLDVHGWNGNYFIRAFADNGENITFDDAIVQAWSVLSKAAAPDKAKKAIESAVADLYKPKDRMILLFDGTINEQPWGGSLAAYPPGLRENNAQYTHGTSWLPRAVAELGDSDTAMELYLSMLPTTHASDPRYGAEPYAVAADIYGGEKAGEGGWTWYTGAAGWLYRTGVETILGLQFKQGNKLFIDPTIPTAWPGFTAVYKDGKAHYEIHVENPDHVSHGIRKVLVDGVEVNPATGITLSDDGLVHQVRVIMGAQANTQ